MNLIGKNLINHKSSVPQAGPQSVPAMHTNYWHLGPPLISECKKVQASSKEYDEFGTEFVYVYCCRYANPIAIINS
jgi:hypothetical protein